VRPSTKGGLAAHETESHIPNPFVERERMAPSTRDNRAAQAASGGAYHRTLHTNEYYNNVNNILQAAQSRADVVAALQTISTMLQNNTFPK